MHLIQILRITVRKHTIGMVTSQCWRWFCVFRLKIEMFFFVLFFFYWKNLSYRADSIAHRHWKKEFWLCEAAGPERSRCPSQGQRDVFSAQRRSRLLFWWVIFFRNFSWASPSYFCGSPFVKFNSKVNSNYWVNYSVIFACILLIFINVTVSSSVFSLKWNV